MTQSNPRQVQLSTSEQKYNWVQSLKEGCQIRIWLSPQSRKNEIIGVNEWGLKVKIKSPPVEGKANQELIEFFSELLQVPVREISIFKGEKSRKKIIYISYFTREQFIMKVSHFLT